MDLLNSSYGCSGMTCSLDQNTLPSFIQYLKRKCGRLPTKKAVLRPGKQKNGMYFINEKTTIDQHGDIVVDQGDYIWLKKDWIYEGDKILVSDIMPITLTSAVLKSLILKLKMCLN